LLWSRTGVLARQLSLSLFRQLSRDLDGYTFQDVGCLNLFDPPSWPERESLLSLYDSTNTEYEILSAPEIKQRWPDLSPDADIIGLHDPLGGYSEPHEYLPALAAACRKRGVDIREHTPVQRIVTQAGRAAGVMTATGPVEADAVISTIHVWTLQLLQELGILFPIKSFVHQRFVTEPLNRSLTLPAINANPLDGYLRPAYGGRLLVGIETSSRAEYPLSTPDFRMASLSVPSHLKSHIMDQYPRLLPLLADVKWAHDAVGLLSFSQDGEPIVGEVAQLPGLYVGIAFHSGGFAYNPAAGNLLAELVTDGAASIDIAPFSPNRFEPEQTLAHLDRRVTQADAVSRRH
jgi:sarcosine oxidase subunit beta